MKTKFWKRLYDVAYMIKPEMVVGKIPSSATMYRTTFAISWPSALEAVLVSLINIIDSVMVSSIGMGAIAAVGITGQPRFIFLALIFSLNAGVTAVVSRRKGENDYLGANNSLRQAIMLSLVLSFVLTLISLFVAEPLLVFAGAGEDIIEMAVTYFRITMVGFFFSSVGLTINAAQRGVGNTKVSMRTNIAANIVNVIFNYLLINGIWFFPKLGIAGAAIATAIGNCVACAMAFISVMRSDGFLHLSRKDKWRFDKKTLKNIANVSSGAAVEQVFMRVGFFMYNKTIASLGTVAYATHQICMNLLNLSFSFGDGLGIGTSSLVGQSLGAKRPDLAMLYGKVAQRMSLIIAFVISMVFVFGRDLLLRMYTDDPAVLATGAIIMLIMAGVSYFQITQIVISGCLRGSGDTKFVAFTSLISITIIRPILTWLLCFPLGLGLYGAWIGLVIDQVIRLILNWGRFKTGKWSKIEL